MFLGTRAGFSERRLNWEFGFGITAQCYDLSHSELGMPLWLLSTILTDVDNLLTTLSGQENALGRWEIIGYLKRKALCCVCKVHIHEEIFKIVTKNCSFEGRNYVPNMNRIYTQLK